MNSYAFEPYALRSSFPVNDLKYQLPFLELYRLFSLLATRHHQEPTPLVSSLVIS